MVWFAEPGAPGTVWAISMACNIIHTAGTAPSHKILQGPYGLVKE